ncbi:YopX family protein [Lactiplantibacillus plantarum]|uniref:YopX family protein n=2 Tax=Lactiplantibacillus plantarum TaxID=1590 RepID=UPI003C29F16B
MIKFRAWNGYRKIMADYVSAIQNGDTQGTPSSVNVIVNRKNETWNIKNDDVELLQFTGLTDVNGKDIYEGDVLRLSYYEPKTYIYNDKDNLKPEIIAPKEVTRTAQVTKDAGTFVVSIYKVVFMTLRDVDKGRQNVEVIGNVHENPELLEADK